MDETNKVMLIIVILGIFGIISMFFLSKANFSEITEKDSQTRLRTGNITHIVRSEIDRINKKWGGPLGYCKHYFSADDVIVHGIVGNQYNLTCIDGLCINWNGCDG